MGFWPKADKDKLYKQWLEHSDLPPDAVPAKKEEAKEKPIKFVGREPQPRDLEPRPREFERRFEERGRAFGGGEQRLRMLYIVLAVAIVMLCVGVAVLLMHVS